MPVAPLDIFFTAAEYQYEKRIAELSEAAFGPDWRDQWPPHQIDSRPTGYLSSLGPFGSLDKLIARSENASARKPTVCFVNNITLPWAVRLGCAWNVDPRFFVSHIGPLKGEEARRTLKEARRPNADGGISSIVHGEDWAVMRGSVDHGLPSRSLEGYEFSNTTRRQHEISHSGRRLAHTNISIYRVNDGLHIVLLDYLEDWAREYVLDELRWFPNQTIIRLATATAPGHLTFPSFRWTTHCEVLPVWLLLKEKEDKDLLLQPLKDMDIDEFLYRTALVQCELEISCLTDEAFIIQEVQLGRQDCSRTPLELIAIAQKVLERMQPCIVENLAYERRHCRGRMLATAYSEECNFEVLMERVEDLELILKESALRATSKPMPVDDESEGKGDIVASSQSAGWTPALLGAALICIPVALVAVTRVRNSKGGILSLFSQSG